MQPILGKWANPIYEFFRIILGILFTFEGVMKLFGTAEAGVGFTKYRAAGVVELACGVLVVLGLFTSLAALVAALEMAAAYVWLHLPAIMPILGPGNRAALYCVAFLVVAARGAGRFSLDATLWPSQKHA